jgi:hypothetical protein
MHGGFVCFLVDSYGFNSEFLGGTHDPDRYLSSVCHKQFLEHKLSRPLGNEGYDRPSFLALLGAGNNGILS